MATSAPGSSAAASAGRTRSASARISAAGRASARIVGSRSARRAGIGVEAQGRFQRGQPHLVEAQRAFHRIARDALDQMPAADDEAGLRTAQELVAGEGDDIDARFDRLARRGLMRQAPGLEIDQRAAAEILDQRQALLAGERHQLGRRHRLGEARDGVIRGMDLHDRRGVGADRGGIILEMRAVGGADLDQAAAGPGHDVGNAEGAADLDQFAARDDHLAPLGQRVQHQQHRGGVVVDGGGGFRAGQPQQPGGDMVVALAARRRPRGRTPASWASAWPRPPPGWPPPRAARGRGWCAAPCR